jgi:hypothetical protein
MISSAPSHNSVWNRIHRTVMNSLLKLDDWFLRRNSLGKIDGVVICDVGSSTKQTELAFLAATQEAMAFVKWHDIRRYRRICKQFDIIVNALIATPGAYDRTRKCRIDYLKYFTSPDPNWNLRYFACVLVHEATHGVISERGIIYDKERRERIERLCSMEEQRFIQRADPDWAQAHFLPFDAENWKSYWDVTQGDILRRSWQRIIESHKKT